MKTISKALILLLALALLPACSIAGWSTYTNATYGFLLQYPSGGSISPGATDTSIQIQLPITPGTNLVEKYLQIDVLPGASPCRSPLSEGYSPPLPVVSLTVNSLTFERQSASEGAAGSIYAWTAYSTVGGPGGTTCVSLTFVLHSHPTGLFETPPPEFDPGAESAIFITIVNTFAWIGGPGPAPTPTLVPSSTATPTPSATLIPSSTPTTTDVPSSTFTPTGVAFFFIPNINLYCRFGPDPIFESITFAMKGQSYPIDGRNLRNTWVYILVSPYGCWVPLDSGVPSADTSHVRVLNDVPTPTPTPVQLVCSQFTSQNSCEQNPGCSWDVRKKVCSNN